MLKKIIALYVALVLVLTGCATVGILLLNDYFTELELQEAMKATNEVAPITNMFHDQTDLFMEPTAPTTDDEITIRIRTKRYNVTRAEIQFTNDKGVTWTTMEMQFEEHDNTGYYDWWSVTIPPQEKYIYYRFNLANKDTSTTRWYTLHDDLYELENYEEPKYSNGWLLMVGYDTPDWAKGTIWYSIVPDTFFNADTTTDEFYQTGYGTMMWGQGRLTTLGLGGKYGGDLAGMEEKLGYLKALGVNAIFANPVHRSMQGVGYGAEAYKEVEHSFGNAATYKSMVNSIHSNGMYYMQDIDIAYTRMSHAWRGDDYFVMDGDSKQDVYTNADVPGWSGYCVDLGKPTAQKLFYTEEDSILQWLVNDIGVDGFRFDTGGWLWGSTETEDLTADEVMLSIRYYLKKANPEVFLLSESSGPEHMKMGGFDSEWNRGIETVIQGYAEGLTSPSTLYSTLRYRNLSIPRNVGFTLYSFTTQHDLQRVYGNETTMKSAVGLLFTFVCAPCIFYGEENSLNVELLGAVESNWISGMNWDASSWNYEMRNYYMAMTELRNTYSCLRTGAYMKLAIDDAKAFISYARFDKNGAAIVAISQRQQTEQFELDARSAGIADGEILTDWLTGKQYTVTDGKIIADVIPGGTTFVTGGKSSSYRQEYELLNLGADGETTVYTDDDGDFTLAGKGQLGDTSDTILFAGVNVYDDFAISSAVNVGEGSAAIMVRGSSAQNSAYYSAVVEKGKVTVKYRAADGASVKTAGTASIGDTAIIRIVRDVDNTFTVYVAGSDGKWNPVSGSSVKIGLGNAVKAGFVPLSGRVKLTAVEKTVLGGVVGADSFDNSTYTALLNGLNTAPNVSLGGGYLTITPVSGQVSTFTTDPADYDWTFKTALDYTPSKEGDRAGVVVKGSEKEWISAGRTVVDGKSVLYFGKAQGGKFHIMYTAEDIKSSDEVIVQLQKIGNVYTAIYSYDGVNWYYIGDNWITMNFAEWKIGILVEGTVAAKYNYASFGDCINDGKSVNTPHTPHTIDISFGDNAEQRKAVSWTNCGGKWKESAQGVTQTDTTVLGMMSDTGRAYGNFRATVTWSFDSGKGWVGMGFGKQAADGAVNDGFCVKYTTEKTLAVFKGDEKLKEISLNPGENGRLKVTLEAQKNGEIIIYVGDDSVIGIHLKDTGYKGGYFCYYTEGVVAEIGNYNIGELPARWARLGNFVGVENSLSVKSDNMTNPTGVALTNYVFVSKLSVAPVTTAIAAAQITLSTGQAIKGNYYGLLLQLDQYGKLSLWEKGMEIDSYQIENVPETGSISYYVMVVKQNGTYKIYVDGQKTPVITYTEDYVRGGVITMSAYASDCKFRNILIENITSETDLNTVEAYNQWMSGLAAKPIVLPKHTNNFNSSSALSDLIVYEGNWAIVDGTLQCVAADSWGNRVLAHELTYDDFRISYDFKATGSGTWIGMSLRSSDDTGSHASKNGGGLMVYFGSTAGNVGFVDSADQNDNSPLNPQIYVQNIPDYVMGEWYRVTIECIGKSVKVYVGGVLLAECTDPYHNEGYIRFASGKSLCAFDNLVIEPIVK